MLPVRYALWKSVSSLPDSFWPWKYWLFFEHGYIMPVVVHFAREEQTGTESGLGFIVVPVKLTAVILLVAQTNVPSNLDVVSVLFEFRYANTEVIQFVSKFANQFVISTDSALARLWPQSEPFHNGSWCGHLYRCHQDKPSNNPSCSQFSNGCISPVASRNVGEGVRSKSGSAYAESHGHSKNQTLFILFILLKDLGVP